MIKIPKTYAKSFNDTIHTIFCGSKIPKEGLYYTCLAIITVESFMKMDKKTTLK